MVNKFTKRTYIRDGRAPIPEKELTSLIMSSIKAKNTKPELLLRKAIWNNNIRGYRLHSKTIPGRPDIVFTKKKLAIFVNGCFWHSCPICKPKIPKSNKDFWNEKFRKNKLRDKKKILELNSMGWKTLVIWECEINEDLKICVKKIRKLTQK